MNDNGSLRVLRDAKHQLNRSLSRHAANDERCRWVEVNPCASLKHLHQLCPKLCLTGFWRIVTVQARLRLNSWECVLRKCLEMGANTSDSDPRLQPSLACRPARAV